jgi:Protein of unknown function (DUF3105)
VRRLFLAVALAVGGLAGCGGGNGVADAGGAGSTGAAGSVGSAGNTGAAGSVGSAGGNGSAGSGGPTGVAGEGGAGGDVAGSGGPGGSTGGSGGVDGGACVATVASHPDEGANHLLVCNPPPTYHTQPPSSGNHYQAWADYKTYATPVPWGHLMHSLEHGAVVIVYNCPGGCPGEVAQAQAFIDALPMPINATGAMGDTSCVAPTKRRVILAPDPTLDIRWAASAWTWTLRADCFNATALGAFVKAHYAQTVENFCNEPHQPFCGAP